MTVPMECHCLRQAELPHTTRLFSTFADDFSRVREFYAHPPNEEGVLAAANEALKDARQHAARRAAVVAILREQNQNLGADDATAANLDRLAGGAVAIVAGQQVGLFTGPSYSFYKALSAVRIARQLTQRGVEAVPVFWLATEDHDLPEINHCYWSGRDGLERLELSLPSLGQRVGEVRLGEGVRGAVRAALERLEGPAAQEVARAIKDSYRPEETFGTAFGKLMARLLPGQGMILLDPLEPRLQQLAAQVYRRALEQNSELIRELLARGKSLDRAGYHAQVKVTERGTLLFLNVAGQRLPLRQRNSGFAAGSGEFSAGDLLERLAGAPEVFSANVLLRPVVQDTLLPTAAYLGGPAEIAYYAQAEVVYRRLLGRMPAILPRASFTLVEPGVTRLMKKYGVELRDLLRGRQHLRAKMEREFLSKALARRFGEGEETIRKVLAGLRRPLGKGDKTLAGALDSAERKMLYQFTKLRGKAARAEAFRTGVLDRHERQLTDALYPQHGLQERSHCFLPLLAHQGMELLGELSQRAGFGAIHHQVLFL